MTTYTRTCPRCQGTGKYDRGTCFTCRGAKVVATSRKPATRYQVSAIYEDGQRRILCTKSGTHEQAVAAGKAKMAMCPSVWEADSIEAKQIPA